MGTLTAAARGEGEPGGVPGRAPVRVLVVDDSLFMRKLIGGLLEEDAGIKVVGQARDGREALERIRELDPDVVTLDVEMPRLDGLGTLERLMREDPRPVVMVSGLTRENAEATVASLRLGAVDFLAKPSGSVSTDLPRLKRELQAKVKAAACLGKGGVRRIVGYSPPPPRSEPPCAPSSVPEPCFPPSPASDPPRRLVVVGASTGGPGALHFLVSRLAGLLRGLGSAALLIVQHIPVGFSGAMARSLSEAAGGAFAVREAAPGPLLAGEAVLAPGGYHLRVGEGPSLELTLDPPVSGVRPAVDVTLISAAPRFPRRVLALILTGMGSDGVRGAAAVRREGGRVIAQDRETSVVYGMPRAVAEAGLADEVLPLERLPGAVAAWVTGAAAGGEGWR